MVCITVMYPRLEGTRFDMDYYIDVHVPLAIRLLQRKFGVVPTSIELFGACEGIDGSAENVDYHCICNMYFKSRAEAGRLVELRDLQEETSAVLRDDISKYTDVEPRAFISDVSSITVADLLARADALLTNALGQRGGTSLCEV